jgi:hypothetical protein
VDTPPEPIADMTVEAYEDFVSEMYSAVWEELALYEVPNGGTDGLGAGEVRHGPWRPADCAAILLRWHEAGLLGLCRYTPTRENGADLTSAEANELLSAPDEWVMFDDNTRIAALSLTEQGASTDFADWRRIASRPE